ncbi:MAG: hypothetical protein L0H84_00575 [Pseudonocardia sp.]|nr:hypothetical protein [Pseudonocardia sp.]
MTDAAAWVLAWESAPGRTLLPVGLVAPPGEPVTVGRRGDVPLGVEVVDEGISRVAATITPAADGWVIKVANRNGAVLHPWGLAPQRALTTQVVRWPLVALRIAGTETDQRHWVLLEGDAYAGPPDPDTDGFSTRLDRRPPPLAPAELAALQVTFADFLVWPPSANPPQPRQLKQAAARLGKSLSGVQDRLRSALDKALRLGLPSPTTLTQPDYLHVLVAAGYLRPPAAGELRRRTVSDR